MTTFNSNKLAGARYLRVLAMVSCVALLTACAGNEPVPEDEPVQAPTSGTTQGSNTVESVDPRLNDRGLLGISKEDRAMFLDPNNPLSTRVIYFDYDSTRIQSQFNRALQAHAEYLSNHGNVKLRLEGHTDERGTREYNVALGERRAESVEKVVVLSGAGGNQISTLSFGEERPAEIGNASANRRVELIYVQQ